jgi:hypothetical protein
MVIVGRGIICLKLDKIPRVTLGKDLVSTIANNMQSKVTLVGYRYHIERQQLQGLR